MDNYKIPTSVLIDLSKAFNTLNHDILIFKLKHYGVFGVELNFFSNHLSGRVQYVEFLDSASDTQHIPSEQWNKDMFKTYDSYLQTLKTTDFSEKYVKKLLIPFRRYVRNSKGGKKLQ